ncbi:MAG: M1 family metallopeptidase [Nocardioides sp.]
MTRAGRLAAALAALLACSPLAACDDRPAADRPGPRTTTSSSATPSTATASLTPSPGPVVTAGDPALDVAVSHPVEDRVYPRVGDPSVDALHYDLALAWDPATDTLAGVETLVLRATGDGGTLRLDLAPALHVSSVRVDGRAAAYDHLGKDLLVHTPTVRDRRYTLELRYTGSPRPVHAPTARRDIEDLGWTVDAHHGAWTMQEPYGAYTWYAVNDQPSDKALYTVTVTAPAPMVGVANGRLVARDDHDGLTVRRWVLDRPASSYLVTVAVGAMRETRGRSASGVRLTYWTPAGDDAAVRALRATPAALAWVEQRLGPYPYPSLGVLVVDSASGMETQTMLTLGDTPYTTAPEVLVHEIVHQWYGDEVTPRDWRDVWMSEGMALYLQGVWQAQHDHRPLAALMRQWARAEPRMRADAGPPADYDPSRFGEGNIYYGPALMWDALRQRLGDAEFYRLVRAWPRTHADRSAGYADITSWWSRRTGQDLGAFFDSWLLGRRSPAAGQAR